MNLPVINAPKYALHLVGLDREVHYRPFQIGEEKILLMAMESGEQDDMVNAVKQILTQCIDEKDINIDDMPVFDIEHLFLHIRKRSIGEEVELTFSLNKCKEKGCETPVTLKINLDDIVLDKNPEHQQTIQLTDEIGVVMRYPTLKMVGFDNANNVMNGFALVRKCLEKVFTSETSFSTKDCTDEEIDTFINSLNKSQFAKIEAFFETMPKISKTFTVKCPKCGETEDITLDGIHNFFV